MSKVVVCVLCRKKWSIFLLFCFLFPAFLTGSDRVPILGMKSMKVILVLTFLHSMAKLIAVNFQSWISSCAGRPAASNFKPFTKYILFTKREVKMAGYWPSSLFPFLWTETKWRSITTQKENEANAQLS